MQPGSTTGFLTQNVLSRRLGASVYLLKKLQQLGLIVPDAVLVSDEGVTGPLFNAVHVDAFKEIVRAHRAKNETETEG